MASERWLSSLMSTNPVGRFYYQSTLKTNQPQSLYKIRWPCRDTPTVSCTDSAQNQQLDWIISTNLIDVHVRKAGSNFQVMLRGLKDAPAFTFLQRLFSNMSERHCDWSPHPSATEKQHHTQKHSLLVAETDRQAGRQTPSLRWEDRR